MNFYTNVLQWGNYLLVREVKDGQRQNSRVKYSPTLYSPVKQETGYKTLDGKHVLPQMFHTMKETYSQFQTKILTSWFYRQKRMQK